MSNVAYFLLGVVITLIAVVIVNRKAESEDDIPALPSAVGFAIDHETDGE